MASQSTGLLSRFLVYKARLRGNLSPKTEKSTSFLSRKPDYEKPASGVRNRLTMKLFKTCQPELGKLSKILEAYMTEVDQVSPTTPVVLLVAPSVQPM
jgi:hypothetical protein